MKTSEGKDNAFESLTNYNNLGEQGNDRRIVHRLKLNLEEKENIFELAAGWEPLDIVYYRTEHFLFVLMDPNAEKSPCTFVLYDCGVVLPKGLGRENYVGTACHQIQGSTYHIFYRPDHMIDMEF